MTELIPAIDIIGGKCVRLVQGSYQQKTIYPEDPLVIAGAFADMGVRRLHLVDLDGALKGEVVNLVVLEQIVRETGLIVDFGGGVKTDKDVRSVFEAGAAMITAGSIAVSNKNLVEEWLSEFGPEKIILGADVREGRIAVNAWKENTQEGIFDFIEGYEKTGVQKVICTDISRDGMLKGPSTDLYRELTGRFPGMEIIASGGVSGMQDIRDLEKTGVKGVIFGKAFYEGYLTAGDISSYIREAY